jgi:hypothetical protein
VEDMGEYFEPAVRAYVAGDWKLANRYADLAKDQDPTLNRDEYRRRAREEAKRRAGPIRGPQGEERWTETRPGPLHFR